MRLLGEKRRLSLNPSTSGDIIRQVVISLWSPIKVPSPSEGQNKKAVKFSDGNQNFRLSFLMFIDWVEKIQPPRPYPLTFTMHLAHPLAYKPCMKPGIDRFMHSAGTQNGPFFVEGIQTVTNHCHISTTTIELYRLTCNTLNKAIPPSERVNGEFKASLHCCPNSPILTVIGEVLSFSLCICVFWYHCQHYHFLFSSAIFHLWLIFMRLL